MKENLEEVSHLSHASDSDKSRKKIKDIEVAPIRLMHTPLRFFALSLSEKFDAVVTLEYGIFLKRKT